MDRAITATGSRRAGILARIVGCHGQSRKASLRKSASENSVNFRRSTHTAEASPPVPTGDTIKLIRRCENGQQAALKAQAELHRRNMLQATTRLEIPGNVVLTGGAIVTLHGWGTYDGNYFIMTARHKLSRSAGFTTEIEARALNFSSDAPAAGG